MLQVAENEIKKRLAFDNPWWAEGAVPQRFRDWPERAYLSGLYALVAESKVRRAAVLLGPRRVGKTVMLHQLIQRLIDDATQPKTILYVSVDTPVYTGLPLERLLALFREIHGHERSARLFVFFDEIQYHPKWEVHLKSLVDSHPEIRFVASGSAAAALRMKSQESGAGRFTDFLLPPLTFAEFLDLANRTKPDLTDLESILSQDKITALNRDFIDYLNFGGFPEAVLDDSVRGNMDRYIAGDIIDKVLLRDLPSLYGISDTQELNRLFTTLAYNTGNEVSIDELSKDSGVAKNTLRKYLEYLEAAFLIHRLYRIDQNARHFKRAMYFKVYLTNPCIRAALFGAVGPEDDAMGRMAETAFVSQFAHLAEIEYLYYARWAAGEVDLVFLDVGTQRPYLTAEVKWSDRPFQQPAQELNALLTFCKKNGIDQAAIATRSAQGSKHEAGIELRFEPIARTCAFVGHEMVEGILAMGWHPRSGIRFGNRATESDPRA
ncbi:MAG: ATP-binding protein [Dongiaceae bacterium]